MDFRHGEVRDERLDQHGGFTLTDEGGRSGDNGFSTGDAHAPEEESGKFADKPLDDTDVVEQLDERNEEDNGWNDADQEPGQSSCCVVRQESDTLLSETQQVSGKQGDKVEDIIAGFGAQDEQRNDELRQHTDYDRVPVDLLAVPGSKP